MSVQDEMCIDVLDEQVEQLQVRVNQLEEGLNRLINVASECDSWESFPSQALEDAERALDKRG